MLKLAADTFGYVVLLIVLTTGLACAQSQHEQGYVVFGPEKGTGVFVFDSRPEWH